MGSAHGLNLAYIPVKVVSLCLTSSMPIFVHFLKFNHLNIRRGQSLKEPNLSSWGRWWVMIVLLWPANSSQCHNTTVYSCSYFEANTYIRCLEMLYSTQLTDWPLWHRFTVQNPVNDHRYSCKYNLMFPRCAMSRLVVTLQTHTHASKNGNF